MPLQIVIEAVLVDVDTTARRNIHTGIQRVVRSVLPRWNRDHNIVPVAWTTGRGAIRTLRRGESARVLTWFDDDGDEPLVATAEPPETLLLPWNCTILLAEVPTRDVCGRLAALAQFSGNRVVAIGYDCIPVVSADLVSPAETNRFVHYLSVVKRLDSIAAISASAQAEFAGFAAMLDAQGLVGPRVLECSLPVEVTGTKITPSDQLPLILSVGRLEPRKNQLAVLDAAERLWRDGLRFRLQFIGGGAQHPATVRVIRRLARTGRAVSLDAGISEDSLAAAYRQARFTVFVSLQEGYGLPVSESMEHGTPVLTSNIGSMAELAAGGGAISIDPNDDDAIRDEIAQLLTDDALLNRLGAAIQRRPIRTWDDYADQLWQLLFEPGTVR